MSHGLILNARSTSVPPFQRARPWVAMPLRASTAWYTIRSLSDCVRENRDALGLLGRNPASPTRGITSGRARKLSRHLPMCVTRGVEVQFRWHSAEIASHCT
jgi:hypothetical protein